MFTSLLPLRHIVILGGGYAGLTIAQRLSKQKKNIVITLVDIQSKFVERNRLQLFRRLASHWY